MEASHAGLATTFKDLEGLSGDLASQLLANELTSDVVLCVQGERMCAHRALLAARSPVFHAMFFGAMRESTAGEVEVNTFAPATMRLLLRFIYSGLLEDVKLTEMVPLMACADHYGMGALASSISEHLQDAISPETACAVLALAQTYKQDSIVDRYLAFILTHAQQVMKTDGSLDLDVSVWVKVLEADDARIDEIDLFKALVRWHRHWVKESEARAVERRGEPVEEADPPGLPSASRPEGLFGSIRYGQMTGKQLVEEVKPLVGSIVPHEKYVQALELIAAPEIACLDEACKRQCTRRRPPIGTTQVSDPSFLAVHSTTIQKVGGAGWNCTAVVEPSTQCTRLFVNQLADPQNGIGVAIFDPERIALRGSSSGFPNPNQWGADGLIGLYGTGVFFGILTEQPVRWHSGLMVEVLMESCRDGNLKVTFRTEGSEGQRTKAEGKIIAPPTAKLAIALYSPGDSVAVEFCWPEDVPAAVESDACRRPAAPVPPPASEGDASV